MLIITNVEVMSAGSYPGTVGEITVVDLDKIVDAFRECDYQPNVTLGKDSSGQHVFCGWIKSVRRVDSKLYVDIDAADEWAAKIKAGLYTYSSEIYFNLKRVGKVFPLALKSVWLLGKGRVR